jgi:hypothetical protein
VQRATAASRRSRACGAIVVAQLHEAMLERGQRLAQAIVQIAGRGGGVRLPPRVATARARRRNSRFVGFHALEQALVLREEFAGIDGVRVLRRHGVPFAEGLFAEASFAAPRSAGGNAAANVACAAVGAFVGELGSRPDLRRPCAPRRCRASARA